MALEVDAALSISAGLQEYWSLRSKISEGCSWLARALELDVVTSPYRADALHALGELEFARGNYEASIRAYEAGLELYTVLEDTKHVVDSLCEIAFLESVHGHSDRATTLLIDAGARSQRGNYPVGEARALGDLALIAYNRGEYEHAMTLYQGGGEVLREAGEWNALASALDQQGMVAAHYGDVERAVACLEEGVELYRALGKTSLEALATIFLGDAECKRGNVLRARACFERSVELANSVGDASEEGLALLHLGKLKREDGETDEGSALIERSCELLRDAEDMLWLARALLDLGRIHREEGRLPRALECFQESLLLHQRIGDQDATQQIEHELTRCDVERPALQTDQTLRDIMSTDFRVIPEFERLEAVLGGFKSSGPVVIVNQWGQPVGFLHEDWFSENATEDDSLLDHKKEWWVPAIAPPDVQVSEAQTVAENTPDFQVFVVIERRHIVGIVASDCLES